MLVYKEDDEVFLLDSGSEEDIYMEGKSVMPPAFHGRLGSDAHSWVHHFNNYCQYK